MESTGTNGLMWFQSTTTQGCGDKSIQTKKADKKKIFTQISIFNEICTCDRQL